MSATCMTFIRGRRRGELCGQPATSRRGFRCRNGCNGEGQFEYMCADHQHTYPTNTAPCAQCGGEGELFPMQAVTTGPRLNPLAVSQRAARRAEGERDTAELDPS